MRTSFPRTSCLKLCALTLLLALPVACRREQPAEQPATPANPSATPDATTAADSPLKDVTENTPDHVIGISYPPVAAQYPALAAELRRYAEAARADLIEAAEGREKGEAAAPYELVLPFSELHVSPTLVAVGDISFGDNAVTASVGIDSLEYVCRRGAQQRSNHRNDRAHYQSHVTYFSTAVSRQLVRRRRAARADLVDECPTRWRP